MNFKLADESSYEKFLISEYENISKAYFDSKNSILVFFRYYIIVMLAPITIIPGFALKDQANYLLLENIVVLSYFSLLFSFVGLALISFIASSGLTSKLYAGQVNAIRQYYQHGEKNEGREPIYSLLPCKPERCTLKLLDSLNFIILIGCIFNTTYLAIGLHGLGVSIQCIWGGGIAFLALHSAIYCYIAKDKFKKLPSQIHN
jgi:hypothetical protein